MVSNWNFHGYIWISSWGEMCNELMLFLERFCSYWCLRFAAWGYTLSIYVDGSLISNKSPKKSYIENDKWVDWNSFQQQHNTKLTLNNKRVRFSFILVLISRWGSFDPESGICKHNHCLLGSKLIQYLPDYGITLLLLPLVLSNLQVPIYHQVNAASCFGGKK